MIPGPAIRDYLNTDLSQTDSGCWEWTGRIDKWGYGSIYVKVDGRTRHYFAHRVSLYCVQGKLDPTKLVCHRCNNPRCVNPNHLYEGTHADNARDRRENARLKRESAHA